MTDHINTPGTEWINGQPHLRDGQGRLQPLSTIKAQDLLEHELVHKIIGFADELNAQIARFKGHCFEDVGGFLDLLAQEYGTTRGGAGGNMQLLSHDGTLKVVVQVAKHFDYGPELQIAKDLVDECLRDWSDGAREELVAIVADAFNVNEQGKISRDKLLSLKKMDFDDERWKRAMQAITDAERAVGSKTYMRFYRRPTPEQDWKGITIDMAKA